MPDPEGHEKREGTELELAAAGHAADVLIMAAKAGVRPDAAKVAELMKLWGTEGAEISRVSAYGRDDEGKRAAVAEPEDAVAGVAQVAVVEHAAVQAAVPAVAEGDPNLKAKVDELISRCSVGRDIVARGELGDIFKEIDLKYDHYKVEIGKFIIQSIEEGIEAGESVEMVGKKVAILHDFPKEVGGGGFTKMLEAPELREKLLRKLLTELPNFSDPVLENSKKGDNRYFEYIYDRVIGIGGAVPDDWELRKEGRFQAGLKGNARVEAILKYSLGMMGTEEILDMNFVEWMGGRS